MKRPLVCRSTQRLLLRVGGEATAWRALVVVVAAALSVSHPGRAACGPGLITPAGPPGNPRGFSPKIFQPAAPLSQA